MNRCLHTPRPLRTSLLGLSVCLLALALPHSAFAQVAADNFQRQFPDQAVRGVIKVVNPPEILLDGKAALLSPGSRIRNTDNLIVVPNTLIGQEMRVNYTREATGRVHDVWVLTPTELSQQRAGNNDYIQRNFRFASEE